MQGYNFFLFLAIACFFRIISRMMKKSVSFGFYLKNKIMQRYVEQLIEDIRMIAKNPPHLSSVRDFLYPTEDGDEAIDDAEKFVSGNEICLSDIVGLPKSALPDHRKLSDRQVRWLHDELIIMLNAWNFNPEFPCKLPVRLQYQTIRDHWDEKTVYVRTGIVHIGYCSYDRDECPFPEHCTFCDEMLEDEYNAGNNANFDVNAEDLLPEVDTIMNHPLFSKLAKKQDGSMDTKGFIPGIYNYCDRWCERCDFTERCSVFASEKDFERIADAPEGEREALIDEMEKRIFGVDEFEEFDDTDEEDMEEFPEMSQEIDEEEYENEQNDLFSPRKQAERHPLVLKTRDFSDQSNKWLEMQMGQAKLDFQKLLALGTADLIFQALEVFDWFHFFIFTKMQRAMNGHFEMEENEFAEDDMNGSAKVALLGIDESIEALTLLQLHLRNEKTAIVSYRKMLEEIRYEAEQIFPNARHFIRPGLDEVEETDSSPESEL